MQPLFQFKRRALPGVDAGSRDAHAPKLPRRPHGAAAAHRRRRAGVRCKNVYHAAPHFGPYERRNRQQQAAQAEVERRGDADQNELRGGQIGKEARLQ